MFISRISLVFCALTLFVSMNSFAYSDNEVAKYVEISKNPNRVSCQSVMSRLRLIQLRWAGAQGAVCDYETVCYYTVAGNYTEGLPEARAWACESVK